jgi:hypothetical protein
MWSRLDGVMKIGGHCSDCLATGTQILGGFGSRRGHRATVLCAAVHEPDPGATWTIHNVRSPVAVRRRADMRLPWLGNPVSLQIELFSLGVP